MLIEKEKKTIPFSTRINPKLKREVMMHCLDKGLKVQYFVEVALQKALKEKKCA